MLFFYVPKLELECLHLYVKQVFAVGVARVLTQDTEKVFILCNNSWEKNMSELKSAYDWHWKSVFYATTAEIRTYWSLKSTYAWQWKVFFVRTAEKGHVIVGRVSTSSQWDVFLYNNSRKKDIMELEECLHLRVKSFFYVTTTEKRIYWVGRVLILESEIVSYVLEQVNNSWKQDMLELRECLHLRVKKFFYVTTTEKRVYLSYSKRVLILESEKGFFFIWQQLKKRTY